MIRFSFWSRKKERRQETNNANDTNWFRDASYVPFSGPAARKRMRMGMGENRLVVCNFSYFAVRGATTKRLNVTRVSCANWPLRWCRSWFYRIGFLSHLSTCSTCRNFANRLTLQSSINREKKVWRHQRKGKEQAAKKTRSRISRIRGNISRSHGTVSVIGNWSTRNECLRDPKAIFSFFYLDSPDRRSKAAEGKLKVQS